ANATRVSLSTADGIHLGDNTFSSAPFRVTRAGAVTATSATITGAITATSGAIGGINVASDKIYIGTGTFNNANTAFYVDDTGQFSLKDKLSWNGSALTIDGGGTFSGALSAASGTFTGALSGGTISIGSSNSIFKADSNGIYLGNATFGSAPFRVTPAGALTSTSGTVGGFTLSSTSFIAGSGTTRVSISTADGIHLGNNTFGSAPFRVTTAGALTADSATLTSATVSGAITATSGSLSSLAVSGALTVGTSGKITGGTSTSFNTGAGFFLGYDSDAYKFSIGDASTKKNLTWDGTDIKIGGAQITAPDNPAVVIYDARSSSPPSVTNARVVLTSNTNTFYLKQDYSEALRVEVVYPLGLLTSGTVSGEQTAIDSTMASIRAAVSYAPVSDPTNFTLFGNINSTRKTTASSLIGSYLVKTTDLGGGNFKAELQTKTEVRTANPTLSGISLGTVDDEYNLVKSFTKYDFPSGDYVFKVVITITDGTASSYPASGSPSADLIRSVNIYGFKNIERDSFAYAVEPYYQPLTTFRADNSNEVARLSDGADTLELAAINAQGVPRLVMIGPNTTNPSSGVMWGASINFVTSFDSYSNGGTGNFQIGIDKSGTGLYLGVGGNTPNTSSELKITNGRVDVIGSLFVSSNLDVDGEIEFDALSGTGSVSVTDILDQDDMSSNSATALATQQSIKSYVDAQIDTADSLSEILAIGNTSGSNNIEMGTNQKVQFRDSAIYINSSADGQLDIVADTEIQIAATTVDVNGILDVSGRIVGSTFGTGDTGIQNNTSLNGVQAFRPDISSGSADNYLSMGTYSVRWTQIFAVNGTIQTSDNNEKQDVEELNDAEKRVAVSAKSLIKKFRWKSAVAEKGDSARMHFGVVAQDLKSAFESEGLDASRYGLFCSDTWTEDGVEKTRLGVRYNELLAFIISAI
ncbi:MAG: tail fiber domain-containing protein, partial [Paracoccaceae bacterium]